jgi:hypothetical protein
MINGPTTLPEKCFLRCYGEEAEVVIFEDILPNELKLTKCLNFQIMNGIVLEEKLISVLYAISTGDVNKLISLYDTMNMCSNRTSKPICYIASTSYNGKKFVHKGEWVCAIQQEGC